MTQWFSIFDDERRYDIFDNRWQYSHAFYVEHVGHLNMKFNFDGSISTIAVEVQILFFHFHSNTTDDCQKHQFLEIHLSQISSGIFVLFGYFCFVVKDMYHNYVTSI
jgi:hypothetical protein